jgi:hypothetical protein
LSIIEAESMMRGNLIPNGAYKMKLIFSALIVMGVSFAAVSSFAADSRNVSVVNETGYAIKFLGFNGPDDGLDEWDNELSGTLTNQASAYVEFDDDDDGCVWNIKVDWANYNESVLMEERRFMQVQCAQAAL